MSHHVEAKHTASKYDFVKVKVWLGEDMNHYYVLSRFLISRMLTVTKIPYMKAVKIALEVKKYLIDNDQFDVSQENLEVILFNIMESKGFGAEYTKRYKMVNQFHQERRPLIILVCGAPCTGKSSLAQQLASRFNMPNVLQTDMFYELLRTAEGMPLSDKPLWQRSDLDAGQLVNEFQRECHVVRRSIDGDLVKTIRDGKSIIIEGLHLDPGLYLYEFGKYGIRHLHTRNDSMLPSQASTGQQEDPVLVEPVNPEPLNPDKDVQKGAQLQPDDRQSEESDNPTAQSPSESSSPKATASDSSQRPTQMQRGDQSFTGTRMLFALQSMAKRMNPVLSSYVTHPQQQTSSQQGLGDVASQHGEQFGQSQPSHSGSEWIGQQLHKAYKGLTSSLSVTNPAPGQTPASNTSTSETQDHTGGTADLNQQDQMHSAAQPQHDSTDMSDQSHQLLHSRQSSGKDDQTDDSAAATLAGGLHGQQSPGSSDLPDQQIRQRQVDDDSQQAERDRHMAVEHQQQGSSGDHHAEQETAQPPVDRHQSGHTAVEPHGVPDRVPAAVALESSEGPAAASAAQTDQQAGTDSDAAKEEAQELEEPAVVKPQQQKEKKKSATPVFVPIVVAMDAQDHKVMVEEWYSRQMAVSGQLSNNSVSDKDMTKSADATFSRIRLLQDHLCTYEDRNVPVVQINFGNFSDTLDQLHDYLLQCIESAISQ